MIAARAGDCSNPLKLITFTNFTDLALQETGREQVRQVLKASITATTYVKKGPCVRVLCFTFFRAGQSLAALINGDAFLQTALNFAQRGSLVTMDVTNPFFVNVHVLSTI